MSVTRTKEQIDARAQKLLEIGRQSAPSDEARSQLDEVTFCSHYSEPGYKDPESGLIAFGNWNKITRYENGEFLLVDDYPKRIGALLEKLGVELEWSDEWDFCQDCGGAFRMEPDSYFWQKAYGTIEGDCVCAECIAKDPSDYLESLEGSTDEMLSLPIDLEEHDYVRLAGPLESGFHSGQDASPKKIVEFLQKRNIKRFIFVHDEASQFYVTFSVWVHKDEYTEELADALTDKEINGPSNSENLKKALQSAPMPSSTPGQIVITTIDCTEGTATTKVLTPDEFVRGIK